MTTFRHYQDEALETAKYPNRGKNLVYTALGLAGEAGEFADQVKRIIRDDGGTLTPARREKLIAELGDVLWYLSAAADELGISLTAVAAVNLDKLRRRQTNGTLSGEGSDR